MAGRLVSKGCVEKYVVILEWGSVLGRMGILDRKSSKANAQRHGTAHKIQRFASKSTWVQHRYKSEVRNDPGEGIKARQSKGLDIFIHFCRPWIREKHYRLFIKCIF